MGRKSKELLEARRTIDRLEQEKAALAAARENEAQSAAAVAEQARLATLAGLPEHIAARIRERTGSNMTPGQALAKAHELRALYEDLRNDGVTATPVATVAPSAAAMAAADAHRAAGRLSLAAGVRREANRLAALEAQEQAKVKVPQGPTAPAGPTRGPLTERYEAMRLKSPVFAAYFRAEHARGLDAERAAIAAAPPPGAPTTEAK